MTDKIEDGGPAFPPNAGWRDNDPAAYGMSKRDYFAVHIMAAIITYDAHNTLGWEDAAKSAYRGADAMLKERGR